LPSEHDAPLRFGFAWQVPLAHTPVTQVELNEVQSALRQQAFDAMQVLPQALVPLGHVQNERPPVPA